MCLNGKQKGKKKYNDDNTIEKKKKIYLGQSIYLKDNHLIVEFSTRIYQGGLLFGKLSTITKSEIPISMKPKTQSVSPGQQARKTSYYSHISITTVEDIAKVLH